MEIEPAKERGLDLSKDIDVAKHVPLESSGKATASLVLGVLSVLFGCLVGIPAIITGAMALADIRLSRGVLAGRGFAIAGIILGGTMTFLSVLLIGVPFVLGVLEARHRLQAANQLKQIGLAIHNYHDVYKRLPLSGVEYRRESQDKPVERRLQLSWRVRLLAFLEYPDLYTQFNFNENWDSPHNMALIEKMPPLYRSPNRNVNDYKTVYQGVVLARPIVIPKGSRQKSISTAFDAHYEDLPAHRFLPCVAHGLPDFMDGLNQTIFVVEADADRAVIWTKPDDWELQLDKPHAGLGHLRPGGFLVLVGNGSVHYLPNTIDDGSLRDLLLINEGNDVSKWLPVE